MKDPCHGLNLVLKHAVDALPPEIMSFVHGISNHFSSPQRKAQLKRVQEEIKEKTLYPRKLAMTRWLSLGDTLTRIVAIWKSLVEYFEELSSRKKKKTRKTKGKKKKTRRKLQHN